MIELAIAVVAGMTLHEAAHAWAADRAGDPAPRIFGRLTLNPLRHADPVGSLLVPLVAAVAFGVVIGWGRPVPITRRWLSSRGFVLALLAGPAANLAVAAGCWLAGFHAGAWANLALGTFNLLPVGNLDGRRLLEEWKHAKRQRSTDAPGNQ